MINLLRKIKNIFDIKNESMSKHNNDFYPISKTCQIPNLNIILEQYFGRKSDGYFVEVGAFDGEYVSNSSGLADIGWHGYYIEPVKNYYQQCQIRHQKNNNVMVSNVAIGDVKKEIEITVGGPLSTINEKMVDNFILKDWSKNYFTKLSKERINQLTLEEYLTMNNVNKNFELLVIDVEGYEWNVLRNFEIKIWQPKMVIIELHDQNDDYLIIRDDCNKIVDYFDRNNYKVIYKDFTNTIYVLKDLYPIHQEMTIKNT